MINFYVKNNKTFIRNANNNELDFIEKKLKFWKKNFNPDPFGNKFDVINIFNKNELFFPTGYLPLLKEKLDKEKIKYEVEDQRFYPMKHIDFEQKGDLPKLYSTQEEALSKIKKNEIGVIASATGSGKTRLIQETIKFRGVKTLVIVPNKSIQSKMNEVFSEVFGSRNVSTKAPKESYDYLFFDDLNDSLNEEDEKESQEDNTSFESLGNLFSKAKENEQPKKRKDTLAGLSDLYTKSSVDPEDDDPEDEFESMGKLYKHKEDRNKLEKERKKEIRKFHKEFKNITILCFQSLPTASKKFLQEIECVIVDECHHASASTIRMGLLEMKNAGYRYFFSGTPWRDDKSDLNLLLSSIGTNLIYELRGKDAVEMEIISKPVYVQINPPPPSDFIKNIPKRKYREIIERGIIKNKVRNRTIVEEAIDLYSNNKNVFIAVDEISHLKILQKRLQNKGIEPEVIYGDLSNWEREDKIRKVGNHNGSLITIATMAVGQGTDMPYVNAIILASGGRSTIRLIQRIGRGTRKTTEDFMVIDFFDWYHEKLIEHSRNRQKTFKEEYEELSGLDHFINN
jgi:superfamily II DNA or RNA helicase